MTGAHEAPPALPTCELHGMRIARVGVEGLLEHLFSALRAGQGGWLVTANLDFLRRYSVDPVARALYDAADVRVADGAPLVWAAHLQGDRLPERVAGSSLMPLLAKWAAREGRSMYLLGGDGDSAFRAGQALTKLAPGLRVVGADGRRVSAPPGAAELAALATALGAAEADLVLVGLGSPKQELLIQALRPHLPRAWMVGVGISFSFLAGDIRRAPVWVQRIGLEWVHRLWQEPCRLGRRYLVQGLPFSARLFWRALARRAARGKVRAPRP